MPVIKTCKQCKIEFKVKPSHADKRFYCSRKCMDLGRIKEKLKKICEICGKEFEVYNNQWRKDAKYCGNDCNAKSRLGEKHWNYKHGEKWRKEDRQEYQKQHYQSHKKEYKRRAFINKPKTRGSQLDANYTYKDWLKLVREHKNRCYYCGIKMTRKEGLHQRTRDHIVPLSNGGLDVLSNIVPACKSCNGRKTDKSITEWKGVTVIENTHNAEVSRVGFSESETGGNRNVQDMT